MVREVFSIRLQILLRESYACPFYHNIMQQDLSLMVHSKATLDSKMSWATLVVRISLTDMDVRFSG